MYCVDGLWYDMWKGYGGGVVGGGGKGEGRRDIYGASPHPVSSILPPADFFV